MTEKQGLYHKQHRMDDDDTRFGELRESNDVFEDAAAMHQRMQEDGYLFIRGCLDSALVANARRSILESLLAEGVLDPEAPLLEARVRGGAAAEAAARGAEPTFRPDLAASDPHVQRLLYGGEMMAFFERFLGGEVRHYDYTWLRAKIPMGGEDATQPHCDVVYMGRGTHNLYTAWTPLGDVPREMGGLIILEGSHKQRNTLGEYWDIDVDTYCDTTDEEAELLDGTLKWASDKNGGAYDLNPVRARDTIGGRFLTTDYRAGDMVVFSIFTLHSSLNNTTDRVRISTDSRYQLASEPVDERWIGENPPAHGPDAKVSMIC